MGAFDDIVGKAADWTSDAVAKGPRLSQFFQGVSASTPDLRPTPARPLVHQSDPATLDEGLNKAAQWGIGAGLALGPGALGGPMAMSIPAMIPSAVQAATVPWDNPDPNVDLGIAAWKKRGVPPELIEQLAQPRDPLMQRINAKNTEFHATDPERMLEILKSGEIRPGVGYEDSGVSTSRIPRVASKGQKAVSFVIDRSEMPPNRPYAEPEFQKTQSVRTGWYSQLTQEEQDRYMALLDQGIPGFGNGPTLESAASNNAELDALQKTGMQRARVSLGKPNRQFEFENRTYNTPIPTSAADEIWVDQRALQRYHDYLKEQIENEERPAPAWWGSTPQELEDNLNLRAQQYGKTMRVFPNGRAMHAARARLSTTGAPPPLPRPPGLDPSGWWTEAGLGKLMQSIATGK